MTKVTPILATALLVGAAAHAAWAQQQWNDPLPPAVEPETNDAGATADQLIGRIQEIKAELRADAEAASGLAQSGQQPTDPEPPPVIEDAEGGEASDESSQ